MTFDQTFHAVLVGGSEGIVRSVVKPGEPVAVLFHLEQTLSCRMLYERCSTGRRQSTDDLRVDSALCELGAILRREPFGSVPEVMLPMLRVEVGAPSDRTESRCARRPTSAVT